MKYVAQNGKRVRSRWLPRSECRCGGCCRDLAGRSAGWSPFGQSPAANIGLFTVAPALHPPAKPRASTPLKRCGMSRPGLTAGAAYGKPKKEPSPENRGLTTVTHSLHWTSDRARDPEAGTGERAGTV